MTTFESLYHLSPNMAWRLRSAYAPKSSKEQINIEILAQRSGRADGIMKGLEVAKNCEVRVCEGLRNLGELISYCERLKGAKFSVRQSKKFQGGLGVTTTSVEEESSFDEEDDQDLEVAESMFAYFCEKNVLPMLIDSLLCHPPPLTSSDVCDDGNHAALPSTNNTTIGSSPSPFSGVTWTASVKSQILQTIAMILFNTSSPLSLTFLLSNNYMNELIMGILPLDQWKEEALEEILPPYITLLRGLVMKLRGEANCCLPLFLCQREMRLTNNNQAAAQDEKHETYLPLLYAAVQVFCSPFGTSLRDSEGCLIRVTAMNVILNLARIHDPEVRLVLVQGVGEDVTLPTTKSTPTAARPPPSMLSHPLTIEQELLFPHICNSVNTWFHRSVRLVMASLSIDDRHDGHDEAKAEAKARHKDIAEMSFRELQYWLGFLDDLLSCELRVWNARLVEWFMREVVVGNILLSWSRSLEIIGRQSSDHDAKLSMDEYKARAEIRVAIVFFTQLFGMIEYSPLVRMVGAVLLCHKYPQPWCELDSNGPIDFAKAGGFFVVTPAINSLVSPTSATRYEADAGAGVRASSSHDAESSTPNGEQKGSLSRTSSGGNSSELDHQAIETVAAEHHFHQLANDVEQSFSTNGNNRYEQLTSNRHRTGLLNMIAGDDAYSTDETLLASMLMATILENDAMDDAALEQFGVLPSPTVNDEGDSPFEISIAKYLSQDWPEIDSSWHSTSLANAIECVSTLGMMLLERLVFHTWTEGGTCVEVVPFQHEYNNSKFIQALGRALEYFATQAQTHLDDTSIRDICSDMIKQRYSVQKNDTPESPRCNESDVKMVCSLQSRYPSNFIDNSSVLAGEIVYEGALADTPTAAGGDLFLFNHDSNELKFALQATIHLRSVLGCIQDFRSRTISPHSIVNSRWQGEGETLSFRTTEEADEILLSIAGIQTSLLPEVGMDIDLRGRTFFRCSLPHKFGHKHIDITIDANGATLTVTDKEDLVLVIDPTEIFVVKQPKKQVPNRCTVLAVVPLRTIVASATEGNILHIVCLTEQLQSNIVKDGRLSLKFQRDEQCSVKECVDKHCAAFEKKITMDMSDMLDKCVLMGNSNNYSGNSHSQSTTNNEMEDSWS